MPHALEIDMRIAMSVPFMYNKEGSSIAMDVSFTPNKMKLITRQHVI